jgi:hypothetical protein
LVADLLVLNLWLLRYWLELRRKLGIEKKADEIDYGEKYEGQSAKALGAGIM